MNHNNLKNLHKPEKIFKWRKISFKDIDVKDGNVLKDKQKRQ